MNIGLGEDGMNDCGLEKKAHSEKAVLFIKLHQAYVALSQGQGGDQSS